jgi:hypothetical protein
MLRTILIALVVTSFTAPALAIPRGAQPPAEQEQVNKQAVAKAVHH